MLSYVQRGLADIWKKNIIEDLEKELLNYKVVEEFVANLKKEFGGGWRSSIEEIRMGRKRWGVHLEIQKKVRENRYKRRPLIKDFKRGWTE